MVALALLLWLGGCGGARQGFLEVRLPNGARFDAQLRLTPDEQASGMMFRPSLPPNQGMLFIHATEEPRSYWMFQCEIPLDIIWMDREKRVVEISKDTPPCREAADKCPSFGGTRPSKFVLELNAGMADAHGLKVGDIIKF
jgi:hypothetical protein